MKLFCMGLISGLVVAATPVVAQTDAAPPPAQTVQKPGLWELTGTVKSQSGEVERAVAEAQAQIEKLPAEQRRQIEKMMAERGVGLSHGETTAKVCLTALELASGAIPIQAGDCNQQVLSRDGSLLRVSFTCRTDPPASGIGEIRQLTPTSTLLTATVETTVNGKPDRLNTVQRGRWIGECEPVAPGAAP